MLHVARLKAHELRMYEFRTLLQFMCREQAFSFSIARKVIGRPTRSIMVNGYIQIILRRTVIKARTHAQYKGRAVQTETNGRTDTTEFITVVANALTRSEKMALRYDVYLTVSGSAISGYLRSSTTLNSSNCKHLPTGWVPTVAPPRFCNRGK